MTESHWYIYTAELYLFTGGNNTAWETVTGKTMANSDRGAAIAAEQELRMKYTGQQIDGRDVVIVPEKITVTRT